MYSYILGIPDSQKKRALGFLKQQWVEFEEHPSIDGFFEVRFIGMEEEEFRHIVNKLKQQGAGPLIGADTYLTERKIMKLADLINEQQGPRDDAGDIIESLKNILSVWETKDYASPEERYQEYYLDIEELVQDFEEEMVLDKPDLADLKENKMRNKIRSEIKRLMQ